MTRLLFVCSRNHWRSPTAEAVYQNDPRVEVSSAGVSPSARRRVTEKLLRWADLVLVMEHEHKRRLREQFSGLFHELRIEVLDIPDDYAFMNPELVTLIRERVEPLLA
ncbi:MAG: phosphotyrosine protein phosphatase [Verrucomicrobiaceae bacterium]|nr:phosphotyrosine protein phosphatase [Verrucomicrobiaceae bacterium]